MSKANTSSVAKAESGDAKTQLKPSEVLSRAADLIEPEGAWTQYAFARAADRVPISYGEYATRRSEAVCRCAAGALHEACWESGSYGAAENYVRRSIDNYSWLPGFNDAPGRTQAEVVAALRKAAELAREDGQ